MPSRTFTYFAYGSNMLTQRLRATNRAPSARAVSIGYLEGRRLTFDKVSQDGSGKCDAAISSNDAELVHGVLFEICSTERDSLRHAEGVGNGYNEELIDVVSDLGRITAVTYIATNTQPGLRPYHWYKSLVIAGAVEHALPAHYVTWLSSFESFEDPDAARRTRNEALLLPTKK